MQDIQINRYFLVFLISHELYNSLMHHRWMVLRLQVKVIVLIGQVYDIDECDNHIVTS